MNESIIIETDHKKRQAAQLENDIYQDWRIACGCGEFLTEPARMRHSYGRQVSKAVGKGGAGHIGDGAPIMADQMGFFDAQMIHERNDIRGHGGDDNARRRLRRRFISRRQGATTKPAAASAGI